MNASQRKTPEPTASPTPTHTETLTATPTATTTSQFQTITRSNSEYLHQQNALGYVEHALPVGTWWSAQWLFEDTD